MYQVLSSITEQSLITSPRTTQSMLSSIRGYDTIAPHIELDIATSQVAALGDGYESRDRTRGRDYFWEPSAPIKRPHSSVSSTPAGAS
jgi:hypothetical protein